MFLKILKWIAITLVLLIAVALALPWAPVLTDRVTGGRYEAYLKSAAHPLDLGAPDAAFAFDEDFYANRFVIFGEPHGAATPQTLDIALLTHLSGRMNLCGYIAELDPAQAWAFNAYLETGDATYADMVFAAWAAEHAQWGNREFREKLDALRAFNAARAPEQAISFIGVDRIQSAALAERLREAAPAPVAAEIAAAIVRAEAEPNRYPIIVDAIASAVSTRAPECQYYGLWGAFHAAKAPANGAQTLALHLNREGGVFEGRVGALATFFVQSNMLFPSAYVGPMAEPGQSMTSVHFDQASAYIYYLRGIGEAERAADAAFGAPGPDFNGPPRATMFRLSGAESPYRDGVARFHRASGLIAWAMPFEIAEGAGPVADYVILVEGAPALTAYSE